MNYEWARAAQELATGEANLVWSRYNAMLAANAIVGAGLVFVATHEWTPALGLVLAAIVSLLGLTVSVSWLGITHQGWQLSQSWVAAVAAAWLASGQAEPYGQHTQYGARIRFWAFLPIWAFIVTFAGILGLVVGVWAPWLRS